MQLASVAGIEEFWYLPVHIMLDLTWSSHVNTVVKKAGTPLPPQMDEAPQIPCEGAVLHKYN